MADRPLLLQGSHSPDARILQAIAVDIDALTRACPQLLQQSDTVEWDDAQGTLKAFRRSQIGKLTSGRSRWRSRRKTSFIRRC
jgi:ATP-dependent helicase HrpB